MNRLITSLLLYGRFVPFSEGKKEPAQIKLRRPFLVCGAMSNQEILKRYRAGYSV